MGSEPYLFFDTASTTRCCAEAVKVMQQYSEVDYGNPSSTHAYGQQAAQAIRDARGFFAKTFQVEPNQVVFTGSGSEADNLAISGVAFDFLARKTAKPELLGGKAPRILVSAIEHPGVRKTAQALSAFGFDVQLIPVDSQGQIDENKYQSLLTPETILISIHRVNNIVGALLPVERLAEIAKKKLPQVIFHTDAIQAFGRVTVPTAPSAVDLISISAHKIEGPKGIGALIFLNKQLLKSGLRPIIWGGGQENGFRSGTQSAALIAGFHMAARHTLEKLSETQNHLLSLRSKFSELLKSRKLPVSWNSPQDSEKFSPGIISLSVPGFPPGPLAKLLEERRCLVATGSACSSTKVEPDAVLAAMGLPSDIQNSAIRVSLSSSTRSEDIDTLVQALEDSIQLMGRLLGGGKAS